MTRTRKTALLALTALAAMALATTNASAQETGVEIVNEPSGDPCGPCSIVVTGESHIVAVPPGVQVLTCEDTFNVDIQHDGTGEAEWTGLAHGAPGCNTTNCSIMSKHWALSGLGELGGETEHQNIAICLGPLSGGELECNVELDIADQSGDPHVYTFSTVQLCAGGARRFEWLAAQTGGDAIEFVHQEN